MDGRTKTPWTGAPIDRRTQHEELGERRQTARGQRATGQPVLRNLAQSVRSLGAVQPTSQGASRSLAGPGLGSEDGERLATARHDRTVRVWDLASVEERVVDIPSFSLGTARTCWRWRSMPRIVWCLLLPMVSCAPGQAAPAPCARRCGAPLRTVQPSTAKGARLRVVPPISRERETGRTARTVD